MIQRRGGPGFLLEPLQAIAVSRRGRRENLDRDIAPETRVAGAIDLAHAAGPERAGDGVRTELSTRRKRHDAAVGLYVGPVLLDRPNVSCDSDRR